MSPLAFGERHDRLSQWLPTTAPAYRAHRVKLEDAKLPLHTATRRPGSIDMLACGVIVSFIDWDESLVSGPPSSNKARQPPFKLLPNVRLLQHVA